MAASFRTHRISLLNDHHRLCITAQAQVRYKKRIMRVGGSVRPIDQVVEGGRKEKET